MRLSEFQSQNKDIIEKKNKINANDDSYQEKLKELKSKSKTLRESYKMLKLEVLKANKIIESDQLERNALNEETAELQIENESLRSEISEKGIKYKKKTNSKSNSVCKKLSQRTSSIYKSIPVVRIMSKDSFGCSPIYNSSFQVLTEVTKRKQSFDISKSTTHQNTVGSLKFSSFKNK